MVSEGSIELSFFINLEVVALEDANLDSKCDEFLERLARDEFDSSELSDTSPQHKDYLKGVLGRHYYQRPTEGWLNGFINGVLGPVPNKLVLIMAGKAAKQVLNLRVLSYLTMVSAIVLMLGLAYETHALAISPFMWILEMISPLGFWVTIAAAVIIWFEVIRAMFNSPISSSHNSVIGYKNYYELDCAETELQLRTGAENWSIPRRIASVIIGGLNYFSIWLTLFLPLSSAIVLIAVNAVYMMLYLGMRENTGSSMIATVQVAKFRASFGRFIYLYYIAAIVATFFGTGMLDNLASMLRSQF